MDKHAGWDGLQQVGTAGRKSLWWGPVCVPAAGTSRTSRLGRDQAGG